MFISRHLDFQSVRKIGSVLSHIRGGRLSIGGDLRSILPSDGAKYHTIRIWIRILLVVAIVGGFLYPKTGYSETTVGKWRRHVISITNSSYSGNPFELEVDATFVHTSSGTGLTLAG